MEEDGEIFEIDPDENQQSDFSMSSYDGDNGDNLVIKPPQVQGAQARDKRGKKRTHHRHKADHSSSRHKSSRHRSRSDHRGGEGGHGREKRAHRPREDRSESGSRRHHSRGGREIVEADYGKPKEKSSRSSKRSSREQHRGHDRNNSQQLHLMEDEYYHLPPEDNMVPRGDPLMPDPPMPHHHSYPHHHRGRDHHHMGGGDLSPKEMTHRDKTMERLMAAEKQKEMSQKEVEFRRLQKEEEKRVEAYQDLSYQRSSHHHRGGGHARPSSQHSSPPSTSSHHKKKKRHRREHQEDEDEVHIISENEDNQVVLEDLEMQPAEDEYAKEEPKNEDLKTEDVSEASESESSESSSDSESDSDSSNSDEDEGGDDGTKKSGAQEDINGKRRESESSTPGREGRFDDSPAAGSGGLSDVSPGSDEVARSPSRSPTPIKEQLPSYYPAIMGCRSVDEFECLNRIAEGTYGVVYRAREKCTNSIVALKRLKMEKEKEGFPITSLREINTLLKGQHSNIVTVREIVVGSNMDKIYIVMDYVEHDLKSLMETMKSKKQTFSLGEVKTLMLQLLRAVHHLHDNWILHRDLKTSNLLLSHTGILKVGDFGLAREYGSPLKQYTPIVVTLWYRSPELLLGTKLYSTAIDVWSVGCIFGELLAMEPLFPGKSEVDQLNRIFKELGTPSDSIWPGYSQLPVVKRTQFTDHPYNHLRERFKERLSDKGFLLMNKFLTYNPAKRITCQDALQHDYFHVEPPSPISPQMFPTWPAKSEHPQGISSEEFKPPKPPSGGKNFKDLGDDDHGVAGFFLGEQQGAGFQLKF